MRPGPVEPLNGTPAFVLGAAVVRGEAVPVIDVAGLLGLGALTATRFITIRGSEGVAALATGDVLGVHTLAPELLGRTPPLLKEIADGAVTRFSSLDAQLLLVLEASRLVPAEAWNLLHVAEVAR